MRFLSVNLLTKTLVGVCIIASVQAASEAADTIRIGAWNIEWLGTPENRSGVGHNVAQKSEDIAKYIADSGVSILSLEEIGDDDGDDDTVTSKTLDAAFQKLNTDLSTDWHYELFPKKDSDSLEQHVGVAWNAKIVQKQGDTYKLPVDDFHFDFDLLERGVHAAKFTTGAMKTDFVLVPLHLKSNRGGAPRTSRQRAIEAQRIVAVLDDLEANFDDSDVVLLGDINVLSSGERAVERLTDEGTYLDLNSSDLPTTFSGPAPFDRIFVKVSEPEFESPEFEVFVEPDHTSQEHKKLLSDHYMVVCQMAIQDDDDTAPINPRTRGRSARALVAQAESESEPEVVAGFESVAPQYQGPNPDEGFELSQDYPKQYQVGERFPWEEVDFRTHPKAYMNAALRYCFEGNEAVDFVVQKNIVRNWYHAPWLHDDGLPNGAGREYIHGMTRERRSRPGELHPLQKDYGQNWAVGFYNDRGGYTLGNVWQTSDGSPNPYACTFPDNTITFKLLFTDAPVEQVPYLKVSDPNDKGALVWEAHIYENTEYKLPRVVRKMRLLQVDVAIKDPRASETTSWVFGTFIFDGSRGRKSLIENLVCVGVTWHDDAKEFSRVSAEPVENTRLRGSIVNSELLDPRDGATARMYHLGLGGRMNGPVDNQISSCISCHGRAALGVPTERLSPRGEAQVRGRLMPFFNALAAKPSDFSRLEFDRFFRSIRGGSHLEVDQGVTYVTTDYSQQAAVGIRNFYQRKIDRGLARSLGTRAPEDNLPRGTRGEQ